MNYISLFLCFIFISVFIAPNDGAAAPPPAPPLTLGDCLAIALDKSSELAQVRADMAARQAGLRSARKDLYPSLAAQYGYQHQPQALFSSENYFSYGLSASQPIYRGGALVTAVELQRLAVTQADYDLAQARQDTILAVTRAYFGLLEGQKLETEAEQALARLQSHLRDARAFYETGLVPKNDLLQSEVQLAQGEQDLIRARSGTALARTALNIRLRAPAGAPLLIEDILTFTPRTGAWEEYEALALARRPEIKQTALATEQAEKNVLLARASYLPSVTLSASYLRQGDEPLAHSFPLGASEVKTAGISATWKFWSWRQSHDQVFQARQQVRQAEEADTQVRDAVVLEVREAFLNLTQAGENISVSRKAVEQAEENFRISEARYKAQLATSTEVLDAQTLLTQAKTNYFQALYGYNVAAAELDWAVGVAGEDLDGPAEPAGGLD